MNFSIQIDDFPMAILLNETHLFRLPLFPSNRRFCAFVLFDSLFIRCELQQRAPI